jgi:GT2 family glycosyltransferase
VSDAQRAAGPVGPVSESGARVGVVVVNWRRPGVTEVCLRALQRLAYPDWFPVLVDNGCSDFADARVEALHPGGRYLRTAENLGFAGGSNLGMRAALDGGADFVWFLNNDAEPEPAALAELVAAAQRPPGAAVAGAKILLGATPARLDSVALRVDRRTGRVFLLGHDEVDHGQYDGLGEVVAVTGCAMLVSRAAGETLHGFDERFFSYLEDADLCLRARAAGLRVVAAPRARVLHHRSTATGGRQSPASLYYATRNHLFLMQRHGSGGSWLRSLFLVALNLAYAARPGSASLGARLGAVGRGAIAYYRGESGAAQIE